MRNSLFLHINGKPIDVRGDLAFVTLSDFLRQELAAVGTKVVCAEGDCGACTVLIGRPEQGQMVYRPINSCIQQMHQLDATHVITVEGLRTPDRLHAIQQSMIRCHGAQCGYCTPGFITTLAGLLEETPTPTASRVRDALTGNLCRCTGYEPIIKAALEVDPQSHRSLNALYPPEELCSQLESHATTPVRLESGDRRFSSPISIADAVAFKAANPGSVIVQGGTDVGVWCNKRAFIPAAVLSLAKIPGLDRVEVRDGVAKIGASVKLHALEEFFAERVPAFQRILRRFGSPQIRHAGTLAGNIINASPIADTLPFLYVMEARIELTGLTGSRLVDIQSFYRGYKNIDLSPDEILTGIDLPLPATDEVVELYKVSKRRDMDISTFTAAIRLTEKGRRIESARIAYGGVGPVILRLPQTELALQGQPMTEATFARAGMLARSEITPIDDVRGSRQYRLQLAENILRKFYHEHTGKEAIA